MRTLLYEQWSGGHYANYLRCLLPAVAAASSELFVAVNAATRLSIESTEIWRSLPNAAFVATLPDVGPELRPVDRVAAARNLLACLRAVRPDFTLIPSADAQASGLALLGATGLARQRRLGAIEGTLHYGYGPAAASARNRLKESVYSATVRHVPFSSINLVNFAYYEYALARRLVVPERLRLVGDPVPQPPRVGRPRARERLGLDPARRYVGLFGSLDRRKAIPELLAAFRVASLDSDVHLVLGGRLDTVWAALVASHYGDLVRSGRVVLIDRFLSDEELESAYQALDLATIAYYSFPGLASLALKAIVAGTPVIAHDFGWLASIIRRFDVGVVTDIFDAKRFGAAIRDGLERPSGDEGHPGEAVQRLLAFHETSNFVARMTSGLHDAAGLARTKSVDWEWVVEALPPERRAIL